MERLLLPMIATGEVDPYSAPTRERLAQQLGVPEVAVSSVQSALRSLARRSLVFKTEGRSEYEIEDPMFWEWLLAEKI